jgi:tripartite-type tricarboxylate transporter receptor subunit TctC
MTPGRKCLWIGLLSLLAPSALAGSAADAQTYPASPVRFITQMAAGSGTDPAMRIVVDQLGKMWGQQTVLVNQPGAGGSIAARSAATAAPDGNTLFMAVASTFTSLPVTQRLPFNVDEFVPIGFVGEVPIAIAATPSLPVKSLPELIALSKKQPGKLNVGFGITGGVTHLTVELFRKRAGADLTTVAYPGSAQAMSDALSGRIQVFVDGLAGPIAGGQLKLLGIAAPGRVSTHPDIPAVTETVPGFVATGWFVLVAPPRTPAAIVAKVSDDLRAVLGNPEVRQRLSALSVSTRSMSTKELRDFIGSEQKLWKPVIDQLGLATQ